MHMKDLATRPAGVDYQTVSFDYERHPDQDAAAPPRRPVVVVGAGPVGLSLAIDLAQRGVPVVVLDNDHKLSAGSRAICFAKRTLEVFDRLGCGDRVTDKGVSWNVGRVFFGKDEVYAFDLLPEAGHHRPAFVNLQQYYVEGYLAERAAQLDGLEVRWRHEVSAVEPRGDHVMLTVDTPDGPYRLAADWVAACDGSRSAVRRLMGLESKGRTFQDRFLIADVKMTHEAPAERWFWFDPEFHPGQSVLLHRQPDGVWRIDFQLGWDADPEVEKRPEHILPRVRALLARSAMHQMDFTLEWASVYTFSCLRMDRFRHGRVIFAGDSAHGVSPFGARGANSGVQDAENLAWKLAAVLRAGAPDALLDTYGDEREQAADENILNSTRATDFITPKSAVSRLFRDAVLQLARHHAFARTLVNSGRLSTPTTYAASALNTPDADDGADAFAGRLVPGAPAADAPLRDAQGRDAWLLGALGPGFTLLLAEPPADPGLATACAALQAAGQPLAVRRLAPRGSAPAEGVLVDTEGLATRRYDLRPGSAVLLRPDLHVCARWRRPSASLVQAALRRALAAA